MASTLLLDTNIVSYAFKGDRRIRDYAPVLDGHHLAISFMTVAELFQWAAVRNWGRRRLLRLEEAMAVYLVFPVDQELCRAWGRVRALRRAAGRPISPEDAWIASTALHRGLPLVTHNPMDFEELDGLEVITRAPGR